MYTSKVLKCISQSRIDRAEDILPNQSKNIALLALPFCIMIAVVLSCAKMGPQPNANYVRPPTAEEASDIQKMKLLSALKDKSDEYAKLPDKVQLTDNPYITKKIAYFTTWKDGSETKHELQNYWAMFSSPGELVMNDILAKSVDDVGTVVLIESNKKENGCKDIRKGNYEDPENGEVVGGFVEVCELTIVDPQIPAVIFRKKFEGQLKKTEYIRKESGRVLGTVNFDEVYSFLAGLPRK